MMCVRGGVPQGAATIAIRYGSQRQQFGPADGAEVAVLDYQSLQWKLMPMLATTYALHFAKNLLVDMYCEMKRSRDEDLIADVHSFSAGGAGSTHAHTPLLSRASTPPRYQHIPGC